MVAARVKPVKRCVPVIAFPVFAVAYPNDQSHIDRAKIPQKIQAVLLRFQDAGLLT
jgi:hypothetical protein